MADLSKKTRFCTICIRKKSYAPNFDEKLKEYCDTYCESYAYIKHDFDISVKGELEDPHYHLVCVFKKNQRMGTRLNELCMFFKFDTPFGVQVDKTISNTRAVQYLLHKNNPEKTQHCIDEIISNYDKTDLECILNSDSDDTITFDYLVQVLNQEKDLLSVINRIGLNAYRTYRVVIQDMIKSSPKFKVKFLA